jgi:hypothetical protein
MGRPKKQIQKREKVFNFISKVLDFIKFKGKKAMKVTMALVSFSLFIYVVFFWLDTVDKIHFEIIYF